VPPALRSPDITRLTRRRCLNLLLVPKILTTSIPEILATPA
jgi:hypothetical protein